MDKEDVKKWLILGCVGLIILAVSYAVNKTPVTRSEATLLENMGCKPTGPWTTKYIQDKAAPDDKYSVAPKQITFIEYTCPSGNGVRISHDR